MVAVSSEEAGGRKLTQLVTNHILGDVDRNMTPPIVNGDSVPNHLWEHGRVP